MGCVCGHLLGSNDEETRRIKESGTPDETRNSESIFFDARQSMTESMMYAPATVSYTHLTLPTTILV